MLIDVILFVQQFSVMRLMNIKQQIKLVRFNLRFFGKPVERCNIFIRIFRRTVEKNPSCTVKFFLTAAFFNNIGIFQNALKSIFAKLVLCRIFKNKFFINNASVS